MSPHIVPMGPPISSLGDSNLLSNSARRLEVYKRINCCVNSGGYELLVAILIIYFLTGIEKLHQLHIRK